MPVFTILNTFCIAFASLLPLYTVKNNEFTKIRYVGYPSILGPVNKPLILLINDEYLEQSIWATLNDLSFLRTVASPSYSGCDCIQ